MKKLMGYIALGVAVVGFSACGGDDEEAVVDVSAIVLATEAGVAAQGGTLDTDCAIKIYTKMSEKDVAILVKNIEKFADPEADPATIGLSEDGLKQLLEVYNTCAS